MPIENPFRDDFARLLQEFRRAIENGLEQHFSLRWNRIWRDREWDRGSRSSVICPLGGFVSPSWPSEPKKVRHSYVQDVIQEIPAARELFVKLAADAGSALPPQLRSALRGKYWGVFTNTPLIHWCGLLFAIAEADEGDEQTDPFEDWYVDLSLPFSASIDAIMRCGLTSDMALSLSEVLERASVSQIAQKNVATAKVDLEQVPVLAANAELDLAALEKVTPAWSDENGLWLESPVAARVIGKKTGSLGTYRCKGNKNIGLTFGRDKYGRIWRRAPHKTKGSRIWYYRPTLRQGRDTEP